MDNKARSKGLIQRLSRLSGFSLSRRSRPPEYSRDKAEPKGESGGGGAPSRRSASVGRCTDLKTRAATVQVQRRNNYAHGSRDDLSDDEFYQQNVFPVQDDFFVPNDKHTYKLSLGRRVRQKIANFLPKQDHDQVETQPKLFSEPEQVITSASQAYTQPPKSPPVPQMYRNEVICKARASIDYTPSPYDKEFLTLRKGEMVDVIKMNACGTWFGARCADGRIGKFKMINLDVVTNDVKQQHQTLAAVKRRPSKRSKPRTVDDLLVWLDLKHLQQVFELQGYTDLENFSKLNRNDLDTLQIFNEKERTALLTAAQFVGCEAANDNSADGFDSLSRDSGFPCGSSDKDQEEDFDPYDLSDTSSPFGYNEDLSRMVVAQDAKSMERLDLSDWQNAPLCHAANHVTVSTNSNSSALKSHTRTGSLDMLQSQKQRLDELCPAEDYNAKETPLPPPMPLLSHRQNSGGSPYSTSNLESCFNYLTVGTEGRRMKPKPPARTDSLKRENDNCLTVPSGHVRRSSYDAVLNPVTSSSATLPSALRAKIPINTAVSKLVSNSQRVEASRSPQLSATVLRSTRGVASSSVPSSPHIPVRRTDRTLSVTFEAILVRKMEEDEIDLTLQPYTDKSGFCGIPRGLVHRYAREIKASVFDVAESLESCRLRHLQTKGRHGIPNGSLGEQCLKSWCCGNYETTADFLISIGLPMYTKQFYARKLSNVQLLLTYFAQIDLLDIGVLNAAHREIIYNALKTLKTNNAQSIQSTCQPTNSYLLDRV